MAFRPLLVAALLVLAGCGGLAGNPSTVGQTTVTPAPVPTDSPTPRAEPPAPLTRAEPNATALARLHATALERRSYWVQAYVSHSRGSDRGRTVRNTFDRQTHRVQSDGTYRGVRVWVISGAGTTERILQWEAYGDGESEYRQVVAGNDTSYERRHLSPTAPPPHLERTVAILTRYLDVAEVTVEPIETGRDARFRVIGRSPRAPGLENASNYRVEAVLTEAGRVEQFEASYLAANGSTVRVGFRVEEVGSVRVDQPTWYGEARAATLGAEFESATPEPSTPTVAFQNVTTTAP